MKHPQNLKFRKYFRTKELYKSAFQFNKSKLQGFFGLQALNHAKIKFNQIESCRISIRRKIFKKKILIWIKLYTYAATYKKSVGMRMGKGKGSFKAFVCPISASQILYDLKFINSNLFYFSFFKGFSLAWRKLSPLSKVIHKVY